MARRCPPLPAPVVAGMSPNAHSISDVAAAAAMCRSPPQGQKGARGRYQAEGPAIDSWSTQSTTTEWSNESIAWSGATEAHE